ncbi:hypothetical protein BN1708_006922 [Verticillium longisporum]|uniref:Uncharacterized protein n=1 Tax=Verticillium longisporum TaxID=100787 RepID=A0A0G4MP29_VERLO|nr:hypothetical protein BN1708_006922 [Verticillium longisporum]
MTSLVLLRSSTPVGLDTASPHLLAHHMMSTQDNSGIPVSSAPVSSAPDGRGYRLFELPPEVESALTSQAPPVLYIKHPEEASTAQLSVPGGKTYALQQKNTSNALHILSPSTDDSVPGLASVATVHEIIELLPEAPGPEARGNKGKWHERFGKNR